MGGPDGPLARLLNLEAVSAFATPEALAEYLERGQDMRPDAYRPQNDGDRIERVRAFQFRNMFGALRVLAPEIARSEASTPLIADRTEALLQQLHSAAT